MIAQTLKSDMARLQWRKVLDAARKGQDTIIEHYDTPTAAVIPYEDYEALLDVLDDLRAARRAENTLAAWKANRSRGRDWEEVKAEMIRGGLLDA